MSVNMFCIAYS